jgi:hypothetical protein
MSSPVMTSRVGCRYALVAIGVRAGRAVLLIAARESARVDAARDTRPPKVRRIPLGRVEMVSLHKLQHLTLHLERSYHLDLIPSSGDVGVSTFLQNTPRGSRRVTSSQSSHIPQPYLLSLPLPSTHPTYPPNSWSVLKKCGDPNVTRRRDQIQSTCLSGRDTRLIFHSHTFCRYLCHPLIPRIPQTPFSMNTDKVGSLWGKVREGAFTASTQAQAMFKVSPRPLGPYEGTP